MSYWVCHYHVVWSTKGRAPLLVGDVESTVYKVIRDKSDELDCIIDAMNSVADHIHVAVRIKPTVAAGTWVAQVKGTSSRAVNTRNTNELFRWQEGFGVTSFGAASLDAVVSYVVGQKEHHRTGKLNAYWERTED